MFLSYEFKVLPKIFPVESLPKLSCFKSNKNGQLSCDGHMNGSLLDLEYNFHKVHRNTGPWLLYQLYFITGGWTRRDPLKQQTNKSSEITSLF